MTHNFTELEQNLGFSLNNSALLTTALTHRSYLNENAQVTEDNERLEFLGDAVLDLIVANYLYRTYPTMPEGEMTALRAALVRAESLAAFAKQLTIDQLLLLGLGEEDNGGRQRIPTLCAAFEAVMGAIYLEKGFAPVQNLLERLIAPALSHILENSLHKDARSEFQIWAQAQLNQTPRYEVVKVEGPDHARQFTVQVKVNDQVWGEGSGRSKQVASQAAAAVALKQIPEAR
jgi:ribonuclease-3